MDQQHIIFSISVVIFYKFNISVQIPSGSSPLPAGNLLGPEKNKQMSFRLCRFKL